MAKANKHFAALSDLPTTQLTITIVLAVITATAVRYLFVSPPLEDLGVWCGFLAGLMGIGGATVIGKRYTSDPAVIAAEAAAQQVPPPTVGVSDGDVMVIPQAPAP